MANGFRMRVIGHDPNVNAETMRAAGIEKIDDLHALLRQSDIVSIHAVLNAETLYLIGARELATMKRSAFLINVSRGAIVNEDALLAALRDKTIAGAALDVFSQEPMHSEHPLAELYEMDNVILFPHLTFYTEEAMARLTADTLARCFEILDGRPVLVKSHDPRLRAQRRGVVFGE
jgi:D-3-phosphoglycerate dehydrogenase